MTFTSRLALESFNLGRASWEASRSACAACSRSSVALSFSSSALWISSWLRPCASCSARCSASASSACCSRSLSRSALRSRSARSFSISASLRSASCSLAASSGYRLAPSARRARSPSASCSVASRRRVQKSSRSLVLRLQALQRRPQLLGVLLRAGGGGAPAAQRGPQLAQGALVRLHLLAARRQRRLVLLLQLAALLVALAARRQQLSAQRQRLRLGVAAVGPRLGVATAAAIAALRAGVGPPEFGLQVLHLGSAEAELLLQLDDVTLLLHRGLLAGTEENACQPFSFLED
ncbi:hypothetical protein EYF80_023785 [Liparis tanakae]|uniref:Uncharacterized protein n=1 Tax=Liparis tanakae TaxID=230148 RepID=A0A4Z2HJD8_9TELE|nr:hypothetical protein EYF80_023785 [Liparis tanakae]